MSRTITFREMIDGYEHAVSRHRVAVEGRNRGHAFIAVFEALNWATSIDERLGHEWAPHGHPLGWGWRDRVDRAGILAGIRFARNCAHHDWGNVLVLPEDQPFPIWTWRPLADLPADRSRRGEDVYKEQLAGRGVQPELDLIWLIFRTVEELSR